MNKVELLHNPERRDFRLRVITAIALAALVFVGPFAVYRFIAGPVLVGVINTIIVIAGGAIAIYARATGRTDHAGVAISTLLAIAALAVSALIGLNGVVWVYPIVIFLFYLSPPLLALGLIITVLGGVVLLQFNTTIEIFAHGDELASFLVSATTATIFSWIFAGQARKQREQLLHWATHDPLTGLGNRRSLEHELKVAVSVARRHNRAYGLIIMDSDNFKEINDTRGHAVGDRVLQRIADVITSSTRIGDRSFRYGGDEFITILPDVDGEALHTVCRKLVQGIEEQTKELGTPVTVSLGAALLGPNEDSEAWNRRADQSMYRAKQLGGNRYIVDQLL